MKLFTINLSKTLFLLILSLSFFGLTSHAHAKFEKKIVNEDKNAIVLSGIIKEISNGSFVISIHKSDKDDLVTVLTNDSKIKKNLIDTDNKIKKTSKIKKFSKQEKIAQTKENKKQKQGKLKVGSLVRVIGTELADSKVQAENITILSELIKNKKNN